MKSIIPETYLHLERISIRIPDDIKRNSGCITVKHMKKVIKYIDLPSLPAQ